MLLLRKLRAFLAISSGCRHWPSVAAARIGIGDCEGAEGELIGWIAASGDRVPPAVTIACEYHPWCPIPIEQSARRLNAAHFEISTESHFEETYLFAQRG
ncbi:MAG: hypothetical protein WBX20_02810 [Terrimicrobiaceae bacterium]